MQMEQCFKKIQQSKEQYLDSNHVSVLNYFLYELIGYSKWLEEHYIWS